MTQGNVLIVEDEAVTAMDLERQLKMLGYQIAGIASSGEEAMQLSSSLRPDLVLMDIRLRGKVDGIEAGKAVGRLRIPFLYLTSHTDEDIIQRAKQTHPLGYLVKPFSVRELHGTIQVALCKHAAELKAAEQETWLRTTLRSIGDAVIAISPSGDIKFMNLAAEQLTGETESSAINQPLQTIVRLESREDKSDSNPLLEVMRVGTSQELAGDTILIGRNGNQLDIEGVAAAIQDESAGNLGGVVVFRDITKKRRMELERTRTQKALQCANDELEQFTYAASHDLKEPLRNVVLNLDLLSRIHGKELGKDAVWFINEAAAGAKRMHLLIEDLLTYSRLGANTNKVIPLVESDQALRDALHNLKVPIAETGADISFGFLPAVAVRQHHLTALFQNLISNAVKYRTSETPPVIRISAERNGDYWRFAVRDNGIGFESQYRDRIFGLFKRLHRDEYPGTGMGLAICKSIVERHHGQIWAESTPGSGATFYFTCPIRQS